MKMLNLSFFGGIGITLIIALIAKFLSGFPFLSIMGQLVIAILLGIVWSAIFGTPQKFQSGIRFSNAKLLRAGIILLGMRLNLIDIYNAGLNVFFIALIDLTFAIVVVYWISRLLGVDQMLSVLTATGTGICGAAAIAAISPQIKAKPNETAVATAIIAILGTLFTFAYTFLHPLLNLTSTGYGIFTGGTLHEIAHVIAAADVDGENAVDTAIIVKLTRVLLLIPVAIIIGYLFQRKENVATGNKKISLSIVPWFIFGFLIMSGVNTLGTFSETLTNIMVDLAYLLIAMAMAGLGLNVNIKSLGKGSIKAFVACLIGSLLLAGLGYALVYLFNMN